MSKLQRIENGLLFLTLLFLPTQLGKHFWPDFAYVYSLKIDYLSPTLYFWDILVVVLLLVWLLGKPKINKLASNLFLFFLLTQALSLLKVGNSGAGLIRLEQYTLAGLFGVYLGSTSFNKVKSIIFWALGISIAGESLLATSQFIKGGTLGLWILGERTFTISTSSIAKFDFYGSQFLRPYATFPHPNVLAGFMIVAALLLSFRRLRVDSISKMLWFLAGLTILLTLSRTAIIAGLVSALLLLKTKGRLLLLLLVILLLPVLYIRFSTIFNFDNLSLLRREELSAVALNLWASSPVFGVGLNNFIPSASNQLLVGPNRFLQPVHNIYLLTLSETGIIGLIGLITLLGYSIFMIFKLSSKHYTLTPILLVWGVVIFLGMFDHYFLTLPQGYRLLFLIWGLSFSMLK